MDWMTRTDLILLTVAAYVAIMTLTRLMKRRHDELVADVQRQINAHRRTQKRRIESDEQDREAA